MKTVEQEVLQELAFQNSRESAPKGMDGVTSGGVISGSWSKIEMVSGTPQIATLTGSDGKDYLTLMNLASISLANGTCIYPPKGVRFTSLRVSAGLALCTIA